MMMTHVQIIAWTCGWGVLRTYRNHHVITEKTFATSLWGQIKSTINNGDQMDMNVVRRTIWPIGFPSIDRTVRTWLWWRMQGVFVCRHGELHGVQVMMVSTWKSKASCLIWHGCWSWCEESAHLISSAHVLQSYQGRWNVTGRTCVCSFRSKARVWSACQLS